MARRACDHVKTMSKSRKISKAVPFGDHAGSQEMCLGSRLFGTLGRLLGSSTLNPKPETERTALAAVLRGLRADFCSFGRRGAREGNPA